MSETFDEIKKKSLPNFFFNLTKFLKYFGEVLKKKFYLIF